VLRERERALLVAGGAAAAAILLVSLVILPAAGRMRSQARAAAYGAQALEEMRRMRPEARRLEQTAAARMARVRAQAGAAESPLSRLTAVLREAGFPQQAIAVTSGGAREGESVREESFDLKLENVTFLETARLLARLEGGSLPVVVRAARLKSRYEDGRYLDVTLRVGFLLPRSR